MFQFAVREQNLLKKKFDNIFIIMILKSISHLHANKLNTNGKDSEKAIVIDDYGVIFSKSFKR
jgi:hypothetical protein